MLGVTSLVRQTRRLALQVRPTILPRWFSWHLPSLDIQRQGSCSAGVFGNWAFGAGCAAFGALAATQIRWQPTACQEDEGSQDDAVNAWLSTQEGARAKDLIQTLGAIAVPTQAWSFPKRDGGYCLQVLWSQLDFQNNTTVKFISAADADAAAGPTQAPGGLCWDVGNALHVVPSKSGEFTLIVRPPRAGKRGSVIQVWGRRRLLCDVETQIRVVSDAYFSSFDWDPSEGRICFVAEALPRRGACLGEGDDPWRGETLYDPEWGELLVGLRNPRIFTLDVHTSKITELPAPDDHSCGQCVWTPDGKEVVFTAWPNDNRRLSLRRPGITACYNRPSALYAAQVEGEGAALVRLTAKSPSSSAASPSFSPDGAVLAFLGNRCAVTSGSHYATQELLTLPWSWQASATEWKEEPRLVVPAVLEPGMFNTFPGLYAKRLGAHDWASNRTILAQSLWQSEEAIVSVNLETGAVGRLTPKGMNSVLLHVGDGIIVCSSSSPNAPPQIKLGFVGRFSETSLPCVEKDWVSLLPAETNPLSIQQALDNITHETLSVVPAGATNPIEAVVVRPRKDPERALPVLHLHGGPHSSHVAGWSLGPAALAALGWAVIIPNYRGSPGFGEDALQSLPGKAGTQDVGDCMAALFEAQTRSAPLCADPNKVGVSVVGGSHGGFLAAHIAGQYPDLVRAAVLRNPVCDISSMVSVTDIPDWCFKVGLGDLSRFTLSPSTEDLACMRACSPAAHVDAAASAPHLFFLGAKDLRVPPSQGHSYAKLLREKGASCVEVYQFPEDSHPLAKPRTTLQQWLYMVSFLAKHHRKPA